MKILYVITQGELGGAQAYVRSLAQAAKSQNWGLNVAIGDIGDSWLKTEIESLGGQIWPLEHLKRPISPRDDLAGVIELLKLYQKIQPDIIHLNSSKAGILGSLAFFLFRLQLITGPFRPKLFYTAHGWVFNEALSPLKKSLFVWLEKLTALFKTKIICVSEFDRQTALKYRVAKPKKLITITNGLTLPSDYFFDQRLARQKMNLSIAENTAVIGTIANFYPTKGLIYLIETTKILLEDYHLPIMTIIIGDGELRQQLEKQITELNLVDQVILAGQLPEAAKYLKAFDIAVMPSVKEGFPYFALEAMAAELPLIASQVGGLPEIIEDQKTGYLVPAKSILALAEKLKLLVDTPELRVNLGQAGRQRLLNEFSQEQMINKTFALYQN